MKINIDVIVVANEFIDIALKESKSLSNLKLQKLVYIANGYHLAIYEEPLFKQKAHAWDFGPVIKELYNRLMEYGDNKIIEKIHVACDSHISKKSKKLIEKVWNAYKDVSASQLISLTHEKNTPWFYTWTNEHYSEISNDRIMSYYKRVTVTNDHPDLGDCRTNQCDIDTMNESDGVDVVCYDPPLTPEAWDIYHKVCLETNKKEPNKEEI